MKTYQFTYPGGSVVRHQASDLATLLQVDKQIHQRPEPVKVELVTE